MQRFIFDMLTLYYAVNIINIGKDLLLHRLVTSFPYLRFVDI
jgi:hypothetical protein